MKKETIPLPFTSEDGTTEVPISKPDPNSDGYAKIQRWEHKSRDIVLDILNELEKNRDHGFFDAIMDIETNAELIVMLIRRYIDKHNEKWAKSEGLKHYDRWRYTAKDIENLHLGGVDKELRERLLDVLAK